MAEPLIKARFKGDLTYGNYEYYLNLSDDDLFKNAREHLFPEELNYQKEINVMVKDRAIWVSEGWLKHWLHFLEFDARVQVQYQQIYQFHRRVQGQFSLLQQKYRLKHFYLAQPLKCSLAATYLIWTTPLIWWLLKNLWKWNYLNNLTFANGCLSLAILITVLIYALYAFLWALPTIFYGVKQSYLDVVKTMHHIRWVQNWQKRLAVPSYYLDGQQIKRM